MAAKRVLLSYYSTEKITQLNGAINDSVTSITLDSTEGIRVGQVLLIDDGSNSEQVTVSSITSTTVIVVARASSPQAHDDDAAVSHAPVWNNVYVKGSSSTSAVANFEMIDALGVPTVAYIILLNASGTPLSGTAATAHGQLTDLFDNFLPVRVIDPETGFILFSGIVTDADEKYDEGLGGLTIQLECRDYLEELRNAPSEEYSGFVIDTGNSNKYVEEDRSTTTTAHVFGREVIGRLMYDRDTLIRSLIKLYSDNIVTWTDYSYASGTLAEAVDDGASAGSETAIDVTSAAKLCIGNVIKVESEEMLITDISSNTLTVTRNVNGTTAAAHDNGTGYGVLDPRHTFSSKAFTKAQQVYELGGQNQKSILSHIRGLAHNDPQQSTALTAAGEKVYGYEFYLDPNFTSSLSSHKPSGQMWNYFKRGTRPSTTPLTHGLRVEYPSTANFTSTGQLCHMMQFDFDRAKNEIYTDAIIKYLGTRVSTSGSQVADERNITFELLTVKAVANAGSFIWAGRTITGGTDRSILDAAADTAINPEILQVKVAKTALNDGDGINTTDTSVVVDSATGLSVNDYIQIGDEIMQIDAISGTTLTVDREELGTSAASHSDNAVIYNFQDIATMQYISKTSSVSDGSPAYVLISAPKRSFANSYFNEDEVWRGKTNPTSTFTIKSRPRNKFLTNKTARMVVSTGNSDPDTIREDIVSSLIRGTNEIIRGSVTTYKKPYFYIDNIVGALASSGGTDTITTSNDLVNSTGAALILSNYGFQPGMLVNELTAAGGVPTDTYGYAENVGTTQLQVSNWFDGGSIAAGGSPSSLRYYIPIRAGDMIYVKNQLTNVAGNFTVTAVKYLEGSGVSSTTYDVVSSANNTQGGNLKTTPVSQLNDLANLATNLPSKAGPAATRFGAQQMVDGLLFTSTAADQVDWTGGNITVGEQILGIGASNTNARMVSSSDGNTGQSGGALANVTEGYFIYIDTGSATAANNFKVIRAVNYLNVATVDTVIVAHAQYATGNAHFTVFPYQHANPTSGKGRPDHMLGDPANITSLTGAGAGQVSADKILVYDNSALMWKYATIADFAEHYQHLSAYGSVGAPTYSFADDTNTGMTGRGGSVDFIVNGTRELAVTTSVTTTGNLIVGGALSKASGTFLIDHPVHKDTKKLQHGFIEGPKYDLLYRGRATLHYGKATVDINSASNMSAGTFEALTQDPEVWVQNITGWTAVKGSVSGATLTIEAQNTTSDTVAWLVMAERADSFILESETTDDKGHLIPESERPPEEEDQN